MATFKKYFLSLPLHWKSLLVVTTPLTFLLICALTTLATNQFLEKIDALSAKSLDKQTSMSVFRVALAAEPGKDTSEQERYINRVMASFHRIDDLDSQRAGSSSLADMKRQVAAVVRAVSANDEVEMEKAKSAVNSVLSQIARRERTSQAEYLAVRARLRLVENWVVLGCIPLGLGSALAIALLLSWRAKSRLVTVQRQVTALFEGWSSEKNTAATGDELTRIVRDLDTASKLIKQRQHAFEDALEGIALLDTKGRYLEVNQAYASTCGRTPEEMIGASWQITVESRSLSSVEDCFHLMLENGRAATEARGIRKDGSVFPKLVTLVMLKDATGEHIGHYCFMQDLTSRKRSEEALVAAQSKLQLSLESADLTVWEWNATDEPANEHQGWFHIFENSDLTDKFSRSCLLVHTEDRFLAHEAFRRHLEGETDHFEAEYRVRGESGAWSWILARGKVVSRFEDGRPIRATGTRIDITHRKRMEEELRDTGSKLEGILKAATETAIIATDVAGVIQIFNSGAERMLGYEASEIVGKHSPYLFHIAEECQQYGEQLSKIFGRPLYGFSALTERAKLSGHDEQEWTFVRKDGSRLKVRLIATAVRDANGQLTGFLGLATDVTKARTLEHQFDAFMNANPAPCYIKDDAGRFVYLNKALRETWNVSGDDWLGKTDHDFFSNTIADQIRKNDLQVLTAQQISTLIETAPTANGDVRDFCSVKFPFSSATGQPLLGGMSFDVTEQRQLEQDLRRTNEELVAQKRAAEHAAFAKMGFLACMSHEIRTPLNGILAMGDLLALRELDATGKEYLSTIQTSGQSLMRIVNDILDFSKIEAGKIELEMRPLRLTELLRECIALMKPQADRKNLFLSLIGNQEEDPTVKADPIRIKQILLNLLSNAVKFTNAGGVILRAHYEVSAGTVLTRISVEDTGIGISEAEQTRLFQSFSQADSSINRRFGGTGLGLAISKRLVELMNGVIALESRTGFGSKFSICIPFEVVCAKEARSNSSEISSRLAERPASADLLTGAKILLAEDNPINQVSARACLEYAGCIVDVTNDGRAALEKLRSKDYDLILMDCQMPVMDGFQAARAIREEELHNGHRRRPILALTASAFQEDRLQCLAAGMDDFLPKPFALEELLWKCSSMIACDSSVELVPVDDSAMVDLEQPDLIRELSEIFLHEYPAKMAELVPALQRGDFEKARRVAHWLRSGADLLVPDFAKEMERVESVCRANPAERATINIARLQSAFDTACGIVLQNAEPVGSPA